MCEQIPKKCCVPKIALGYKPFMWLIPEEGHQKQKIFFADAIKNYGNLISLEEKKKASDMLKKYDSNAAKALLLDCYILAEA